MRSLRALFVVLFFLVLAGSAGATQITVQQTTRGWVNSNTAPRLRIYLNKPVVTSDSVAIPSGSAQQNTGYYQSVTCSVSVGVLTIPQFTINSLPDALVGADAKYSAYFYTAAGQQIEPYSGFGSFSVPASPLSTTWPAILVYNSANVPHIDNLTYNRTQINAMFGTIVPTNIPVITRIPDAGLTNEFALSSLADGLLKHAAGTPARAIPGTDYEVPLTFSAPLSRSVNTISIPAATSGQNGYLTSGDWSTFNNKQAAGNYVTGGTGDVVFTGPGSVAATIQSNVVSDAKLRQSAGLSVIGRSANSTGNVADLTAGADFNILRRSGAAIAWGSIDLSQSGAVGSSILGIGNGGTGSATQPFVDLTTTQASIAGAKTFTTSVTGPLFDKGGEVFDVKAYGAVGDYDPVAATGTNNDSAFAAAFTAAAAVKGRIYIPHGNYRITVPWVISDSVTIEGEGIQPLYGSTDDDAQRYATTLPIRAPYLNGSIITQVTAATDAISITAQGRAVNLRNFGIKFAYAIAFRNTGHGIYALPPNDSTALPDWGIISARWDNVMVWGHDGNHYAFKLVNPSLLNLTHLHAWGGGGLELYANTNYTAPGNTTIIEPFFVVLAGTTANGIWLHNSGGGPGTILCQFVRPQASLISIPTIYNTPFPGISPINNTNQKIFSMYVGAAYTSLLAPDFESNQGAGSTILLDQSGFFMTPGLIQDVPKGLYTEYFRMLAGNLQLGGLPVDTAPVAQIISTQSVLASGTNNVAGADLTINGSQGKGTGTGGNIYFKTAPAGGSGSAVNGLLNVLNLSNTGYVSINRTGALGNMALDVRGTRYTAGTNYQGIVGAYSTDALGIHVGGGLLFGGVYTGTTVTEFGQIIGSKENATSGNYAGELTFWTRINGGNLTQALVLDSAQKATFAGILAAGSSPTTLTDSAGKILSAALNTVAVANGGTALTATPTNGQLPIGNGTNYTLAALTGTTSGIAVTNGAGSITLNLATLDGVRAGRTANQTITTATVTAIAFDSESYDNGTLHDTSTNNTRLIAARTGTYVITCGFLFAADATGRRYGAILKNGAEIMRNEVVPVSGNQTGINVATTARLSATDYVECACFHTKGSNLDVERFSEFSPIFTLQYVSP